MGSWSLYFFAKIALYMAGSIGFHVGPNLLFAVFLALPVRGRLLQLGKQAIALPVGIVLFYHDSFLPPWRRLFTQWELLAGFSPLYYLELASRLVELQLLLTALLFLLVYWLLSRKLRLSTFAFVGILGAPSLAALSGQSAPLAPVAAQVTADAEEQVSETHASATPDAAFLERHLQNFRDQEKDRQLALPQTASNAEPFDVLFLQLCSLSWADLDAVGMREHPFFKRWDIRFDRFNSAASYSGPAAIRLLRAGCGQPAHEGLYRKPESICYLLPELKESAGFQPQWVMNHDGVFGNMAGDITDHGRPAASLFGLAGRQRAYRAFNGSLYYDDYDTLAAWWEERLASGAERVALYYNSGSLHDGNRFLDGRRVDSREAYRIRLTRLLDDLSRFADLVAASDRRVVLVIVPEHGANLEGDRLQMRGMREIPTMAISLVATGVMFLGEGAAGGTATAVHEAPSSYFTLATLISRLIETPPFGEAAPAPADYLTALPETELVSENDGMLVMRLRDRDWLRDPEGRWSALNLR